MRLLSLALVLLVALAQALYVGLFAVDAVFWESGPMRISRFVALYSAIPLIALTVPALLLLRRKHSVALALAIASALASVLLWRAM